MVLMVEKMVEGSNTKDTQDREGLEKGRRGVKLRVREKKTKLIL